MKPLFELAEDTPLRRRRNHQCRDEISLENFSRFFYDNSLIIDPSQQEVKFRDPRRDNFNDPGALDNFEIHHILDFAVFFQTSPSIYC